MFQKVKNAYTTENTRDMDYWLFQAGECIYDDLMKQNNRPEFFYHAARHFMNAVCLALCYEYRDTNQVPDTTDIIEFINTHLGMRDDGVSVMDHYFENLPASEPAQWYYDTNKKVTGIEKNMIYIDTLKGLYDQVEKEENQSNLELTSPVMASTNKRQTDLEIG